MDIENKTPNVYCILLNYQSPESVVSCIESLLNDGYPNIDFVIVDNNSGDSSVQYIHEKYPHYTILIQDTNGGYAAGNNVGIKYAVKKGADYILIINPDTIVTKGFLFNLVKCFEHAPNIGIATGKSFNMGTNEIYTTGGILNNILLKVSPLSKNVIDNIQAVTFISGCVMLIRKDVFSTVGYFDEKYFMYMEDIDYSMRVGNNYSLMYQPRSLFYHKNGGGVSLNDQTPFYLYYSTRNRCILYSQRYALFAPYVYFITLLIVGIKTLLLIKSTILSPSMKNVKQLKAMYHGFYDGILNRSGRNIHY